MTKSHQTPTLLFGLLILCFHAHASFVQVQDFENIIITTSETLYLDMNEYFQGNITSFTATPPLYISPTKFNLTYTASKFLYTPSNHVVAVETTKDIFGNWITNSNWYLLDSNYTLYFYNYAPQNLSFIAQYPFINGDPSIYTCGSMIPLGQSLIVSCMKKASAIMWKSCYFNVALPTPVPVDPIIQEDAYDATIRNILQFTDVNNTIITYSKCDISVGNNGNFAFLWNINNTQLLAFSPDYFQADESFCLQDVAVINKTIYFADFSGIVYCAVDPLDNPRQYNYNLTITDNILKMTVVQNNYQGQLTTTIILQSKDYIYLYDWTDLNNPIPKNKYSLPKTTTMNMKYLDINQDFITTVIDSGTDGYNFYSYYLKQNLPGDIYYSQNFPYSLDFIDSARPNGDFVFLTNNPTDNSISANFSQILRSTLQINSTATGTFNASLSVDGQPQATVNVIVISQDSADVHIQSSGQNFGLTVPGQGTFDITGLINGPMLSYQPNNTEYVVLPPFENITVNQNMTIPLTNQFTFYSGDDSDSIYFFYDASDGIHMYNCSGPTYSTCSDSALVASSSANSMSATSTYLYTTDGTTKVSAINYRDSKFPSNDLNITLPATVTLSCNKLYASQSTVAPYLFCLGASSLNILQITDAKDAIMFTWGTNYVTDFSHTEIQISSLFPSFVFLQNQTTIFIIDAFAVAVNDSNTVVSTIVVPGTDATGFNFTIGGQTLLVLRYVDLTLLQYDISHPENPKLVKTVLSSFHIINQFLSDSQSSEYIYLYAEPLESQIPVALVYNPQATANANYWTQIPLSEELFNVGNSTYVPPRFPGIKKDDYEIFLLPYQNQLGWIVRNDVEVQFSTTGSADSDATDYEEKLSVLFTGSFQTGSAAGQVAVNLLLADESVKAIETVFYDNTVKLSSGMNTFTVDPRNCFNGTIDQYTVAPQKDADNSSVTFIGQYTKGGSLNLTGSAYQLETVNGTLVAQQAGSLTFYFPNNTQTLTFTIGKSDPLNCNLMEYNPDLNMILSICLDTKTSMYYFVFTEYTSTGTPPFSPISAKSAGKPLSNVRKVVFAYAYIYVLETIDDLGDFIHLYSYTSPNVLKYATSMTSADLNANSFTISDFVLNYRGNAGNNRLFLMDPDYGLRVVDVEYDNNPVFLNPELITLDAPDNVQWNGIIAISEVGDLSNPIVLLITSSNYKNFFMEYSPMQGVTIRRTFVPISNATNTMPCYADGTTFLLSVYSNQQKYVLVYTVSNVSSTANAQNFPLFAVAYDTPDATATQGCGFTLDPTDSVLYVGGSGNISSYTVSSNITLKINGNIGSDYVTITAHSGSKTDSFQYYLVPPPDGGSNLLFVYIIVGAVALVIIIVLICYCNMRYKRKKRRIEDYSGLETDDYKAN